jgi:hypothetical protein
MPRAAGEGVKDARTIDQIGGGQDQRRMRSPEQDAAAPLIGAPRRLGHFFAVGGEPATHDRFGNRHASRPRGDAGEIAQPGEALEIVAKGRRPVRRREIELLNRAILTAKADYAFEQGVAATGVAEKGIIRNCDELERVASAQPHRVERGTPGQSLKALGNSLREAQAPIAAGANEPFAFLDSVGAGPGGRIVHPPLSAAMLAA